MQKWIFMDYVTLMRGLGCEGEMIPRRVIVS